MKTLLLISLACMLTIACWSQNKRPVKIEWFEKEDSIITLSTISVLGEDHSPIRKDSLMEEKPFVTVEQMPAYPGGEAEMQKFIRENLRFPKISQEQGIDSRASIRFIVDKNGEISDITPVRNANPIFTDSLIAVVKRMPRWIPGKQDGKNVSVYFYLPMQIHLK